MFKLFQAKKYNDFGGIIKPIQNNPDFFAEIEKKLSLFFEQDKLYYFVIYFSGHGDKKGNLLFDPANPNNDKNHINVEELYEAWKKSIPMQKYRSQEPHLLIILDCCYAGTWVDYFKGKKEKSVSVLASSTSSQDSSVVVEKHSLFTNLFYQSQVSKTIKQIKINRYS